MPEHAAILCAPYAPPGRAGPGHLGASNKIASVARILASLHAEVTLVNSAHNHTGAWSATAVRHHDEFGPTVREVLPPHAPWRGLGKALNLLQRRRCLELASQERVACIWVYNAYAFDGLLALQLKQRWPEARLVLEIEDWPGARGRGCLGRLKDDLDTLVFKRVLAAADLVTTVNVTMAGLPELATRRILPLPCILHPVLIGAAAAAQQAPRRAVGYFGGMQAEKGVAALLEALEALLARPQVPAFEVILCGTGPLLARARSLAARHPQVQVHTGVDHPTLYRLMASCAVVVNPHGRLPGAGDRGIFPFKIIEGIAAGAVVLSTPFADPGLDLTAAILPCDGSAASLVRALSGPLPDPATPARLALQQVVTERFSEPAIASSLAGIWAGARP